MKRFYEGKEVCVRIGSKENRMFRVIVGLRKEYVMSPWLLECYMDEIMRLMNARVMGNGVKLEHNGQEWLVNHHLYAGDTVLIADSMVNLQRMVTISRGYVGGES